VDVSSPVVVLLISLCLDLPSPLVRPQWRLSGCVSILNLSTSHRIPFDSDRRPYPPAPHHLPCVLSGGRTPHGFCLARFCPPIFAWSLLSPCLVCSGCGSVCCSRTWFSSPLLIPTPPLLFAAAVVAVACAFLSPSDLLSSLIHSALSFASALLSLRSHFAPYTVFVTLTAAAV
jgi:hypothetical protein